MEKYIGRARHVEIQIFGNGQGHVIHMGERECSVQRRHQKVIEETPCALFLSERGQGQCYSYLAPSFTDIQRHATGCAPLLSAWVN